MSKKFPFDQEMAPENKEDEVASFLIPAKAGIQEVSITTAVEAIIAFPDWIPAFAGMRR